VIRGAAAYEHLSQKQSACRVDGPPDFHSTQHIPLFRVRFLSFKHYGQISISRHRVQRGNAQARVSRRGFQFRLHSPCHECLSPSTHCSGLAGVPPAIQRAVLRCDPYPARRIISSIEGILRTPTRYVCPNSNPAARSYTGTFWELRGALRYSPIVLVTGGSRRATEVRVHGNFPPQAATPVCSSVSVALTPATMLS
jgi:hypothetical protein